MNLKRLFSRTPIRIACSILFATLNAGWWYLYFRVPPAQRSMEWGLGYFFGTLPIAIPFGLLGAGLTALGLKLPGLAGLPLSENDYRYIGIGMIGWSAVGYAIGYWIERLIGKESSAPRWLLWGTAGLALCVIGVVWGVVGSFHFGLVGLFTWPIVVAAGCGCIIFAGFVAGQTGLRALTIRLTGRRPG